MQFSLAKLERDKAVISKKKKKKKFKRKKWNARNKIKKSVKQFIKIKYVDLKNFKAIKIGNNILEECNI